MNTEDEELLYKQVKRLDKSLEHACVQIDAQAEHIGELMKENAKLKEYFSGIYETALNWEKQNERLRAEANRQNDAAQYYCDKMLKYQGERDEARKENAKLRKSRDKLAENLAERTLWTDKDRNKDKVKQSWIEWSEEKE
jgi:regulator of replication initiation timing